MKKLLTFIISILCFIGIQNMNAQIVYVGYLNSVYKIAESGMSISQTGNGVYAGVDTDFAIAPNLYFTPGVFVDFVNYKVHDYTNANTFYARVPLHLKVYFDLGAANLFVSAGPSLTYAIAGKLTYHNEGIRYSEDFFDEDSQRFDIPVGINLGVDFMNNLRLIAGYDFGTINQNKHSDYMLRKNIIHVGLGYRF